MNTVASASAIQVPTTISGGNSKGPGPLRHGSGRCHSASTLIAATASDRQHDDRTLRQDRRRHRHRRQDQDRERVLQAAGQIEQDGELKDVVAEAERGIALAELARDLAPGDQDRLSSAEAATAASAGSSGR